MGAFGGGASKVSRRMRCMGRLIGL
jgi:hypothetical protein